MRKYCILYPRRWYTIAPCESIVTNIVRHVGIMSGFAVCPAVTITDGLGTPTSRTEEEGNETAEREPEVILPTRTTTKRSHLEQSSISASHDETGGAR